MKLLPICLVSLVSITALADHNPILPRPQQVQFGTGVLPLRGLAIHFKSAPSAEDQFAAQQLAANLSAITKTKIEIKKGKASGRSIILNRTGEAGALPKDNETVGSDSRESYTLNVTPKGVEIR